MQQLLCRFLFFYLILGFVNVAAAATCTGSLSGPSLLATTKVSGFGLNVHNTRFQPTPGFSSDDIQNLQPKWIFAVPNGIQVRSQPVVTENALFFGTQLGDVYALNRKTGCTYWVFHAKWEVRTALSIGPSADGTGAILYFGTILGRIFAVNAETGELIWSQRASTYPSSTSTGAPTLYNGVLYAPVSSLEVGLAAIPFYPCCRFQGQVTAFNAYTGDIIWKRKVFDDAPTKVGHRSYFWPHFAPSGAPVWSSPTIDAKRNSLYIGTGQSYMAPAGDASDAIIAMDLTTGNVLWRRQTFAGDAFNISCVVKTGNCPGPGSDFDYGSPPILTTTSEGKDIILAGQKSGLVSALDPDDNGKILWQNRVGSGGVLGGIHWGMAVEGDTVYAAVSDNPVLKVPGTDGPPRPGVYALDIHDGALKWEAKPTIPCAKGRCVPHFSAAVLAVPGAVFASDLGGRIWAFDSSTGKTLWSFNTDIRFPVTVNGRVAHGGAIDAAGEVAGGGQLIVMSGYADYYLFGEKPGNAFIVFEPH